LDENLNADRAHFTGSNTGSKFICGSDDQLRENEKRTDRFSLFRRKTRWRTDLTRENTDFGVL
jgi:hypothetical protein